ncbi:MAG: bifunctional folylpolyglutamate synthase/dihydrofolate synthase [Magnetococcales bacterium]|nr:bifunctional folylpolyglutamate synthase/dihydrofolate synthase [Magnetococcales bacterium]
MIQTLDNLLLQTQEHETGGVVLGLSRVKQLLCALGNPQQGLQFIHVAGTNGKGSVIAFLEAILLNAGVKVGVYTSPHLIKFNERIKINRKNISDKDLKNILEKVLQVCRNDNIPATFFEITTAVALLYFANQGFAKNGDNSAVVILETGLGGRLDATNVIDPILCIITSIAHDHENFLGDKISQIAQEKAGIIKPAVDVIAAPGNKDGYDAIRDKAQQVGANLYALGPEFNFKPTLPASNNWIYQDKLGQLTLPKPGLDGEHQYTNCALAVAGIRVLCKQEWNISDSAIKNGVTTVQWPGRIQWYRKQKPQFLLDGAHNLHAASKLKKYLLSITDKHNSFILIFAALKNKNVEGIIKELLPVIGKVYTVSVGGSRGIGSSELANIWENLGCPATPCESSLQAFNLAKTQSNSQQIILVAGSLYLVGEIQSLLQ